MNSPQDTDYADELQQKTAQTQEEFAELGLQELQVFASPPTGYRMRAEFKMWHDNQRVHYAMFRKGTSKQAYIIDHFPPGSPAIQRLMPQLLDAANRNETLRRKLFQAEFLTTSTGEAVITLIYHRPLDEAWQQEASTLAKQLGCHVIGRSRKQKRVIGQDFVTERLCVGGRTYQYQQVEGAFTQPNAHICEAMLNWAVEQTRGAEGDLLELYCGNGNFTLPMAQNFARVLATEISKSSIQSALHNCQANGINNIHFVRMSSEDFTQALQGVRPFRRLQDTPLSDFQFSTVFVDPPRAGLDSGTLALIQGFARIVYVSCNPGTLKTNLDQLKNTHRLENMALFDQFPFTPHRECGVVLNKR